MILLYNLIVVRVSKGAKVKPNDLVNVHVSVSFERTLLERNDIIVQRKIGSSL